MDDSAYRNAARTFPAGYRVDGDASVESHESGRDFGGKWVTVWQCRIVFVADFHAMNEGVK